MAVSRKTLGLISYLSIFFVIPFCFAAQNDPGRSASETKAAHSELCANELRVLTGSEIQIKARNLSRAVIVEAKRRKELAVAKRDLPAWWLAEKYSIQASQPMAFEWIYSLDGYSNYNEINYWNQAKDPRVQATITREVAAINQMRSMILESRFSRDKVRYIVKKVRWHDEGKSEAVDFRLMVILPGSTDFGRLDRLPTFGRQTASSHIIYFHPQAACSRHACDKLYKQNRDTDAISMGELSLEELANLPNPALERTSQIEYMDPITRETRDATEFAFQGLAGFYSNERQIYHIPDSIFP